MTIVGAGPVGLTAALLLTRHDLSVTVVERRPSSTHVPKAHVLNPRSLEILSAAGVSVDELRCAATSAADDQVTRFVTKLSERDLGWLPFERQDDTFTPFPRINLAQPKFEQKLRAILADEPRAEILEGHRWVACNQDDDGVVSSIQTADSTIDVRSDFLIAADGANSAVRAYAGIGMHGQENVNQCLTISFQANWRHLVEHRPAMFYWAIGAKLPGVFLAYDIDSTWTYLVFDAPADPPTEAQARDIILDAVGAPVDFEIRHILPWGLTAQVADRYRIGRVFLAGDAVHRFPPTGGLGMNTGIQDVHNLVWKIAAAQHGWGDDTLLDSYESERRPVAELNTSLSMNNADTLLEMLALTGDEDPTRVDQTIAATYESFNSLGMQLGFCYGPDPAPKTVPNYTPSADPGNRMPHAWVRRSGARLSTLDLLDPLRFTVISGAPERWPADVEQLPARVVGIGDLENADTWLELVGIGGGRALLVRPDGHIAGTVPDGDMARMRSLHPRR